MKGEQRERQEGIRGTPHGLTAVQSVFASWTERLGADTKRLRDSAEQRLPQQQELPRKED